MITSFVFRKDADSYFTLLGYLLMENGSDGSFKVRHLVKGRLKLCQYRGI